MIVDVYLADLLSARRHSRDRFATAKRARPDARTPAMSEI